jgi:anti-anti-sigma factor
MGVDLKITKEQVQAKVPIMVFHLSGWLDAQSEKQLVDTVQKASDEGAKFVLLELGGLDMITSSGIRAMQKAHQILTANEPAYQVPRLKISGAPPQVYHVLGITGFLINVPMYETLQDAIDSFDQ